MDQRDQVRAGDALLTGNVQVSATAAVWSKDGGRHWERFADKLRKQAEGR